MIQNKAVLHFRNGQILKGIVNDFSPNTKEIFHLAPVDALPGNKPLEFNISSLKAVFFVKDYTGNRSYRETKEFDNSKPTFGLKIRVIFKDGEVMVGTTNGYDPKRPGFFLFPADVKSNNDRCYIVRAATAEVTLV